MSSRRTILATGVVGAVGLVTRASAEDAAPAPAKQELLGGPFADVPLHHLAYATVDSLSTRFGIFTGYPDGSFNGKTTRVRYEFAVVLQRMTQEVQRTMQLIAFGYRNAAELRDLLSPQAEPLGPERHLLHPDSRRQAVAWMWALTVEFEAELAMLGADVEKNLRDLEVYRLSATRDIEALRKLKP